MTNMGRSDRYEALSKLTFISTPTVCRTARHAADLRIVPISCYGDAEASLIRL
jgi:hypothetical protein